VNEKQCSLCGIVEADDISLPWFPGHTCSPECARTKAIVDAIKGIGMLTLDAKVLAMLFDLLAYTELSSSYPR